MLYLVATPIGNLEDITLRALRILREADLVAAEDTRQTRKLFSHFEVKTPLVSYHEHSGPEAARALIRRMEGGDRVALVTDADTPGISDPGHDLVALAAEAGIGVVPIPGPSAAVAAITASGLPSARFVFEGFLPRTRSTRLAKLGRMAAEPRTLIFYESPQRLAATLGEIASAFGHERPACVAREITKLYEEFQRGTLAEIIAHYQAHPPRGECVIVVAGAPEEGKPTLLAAAKDEESAGRNDLIKRLASELGVPRRELYQAVQVLKAKRSGA
ncbi:MAG TPA: 16S rRNA (cytidine(1402)-2'-O)-methyltransferase [Capsulimonadaceae bacterium]|nr:16S rRNA (cytidine(1402)-2'-O)-methyltransferase [Capsulimonadaceae bacterium]